MTKEMKDKVLIVEDELDIATLIQVHLEELDVDAEICGNGKEALDKALNQQYQLVILDVMLPEINGLDICRQLRQEKPLQAILMLTSRTSEIDRVLGLELGADDYMTKPFSHRELQARVRAQLRRVRILNEQHFNTTTNNETVDQQSTSTSIGQLLIDQRYHQVLFREEKIALTSTEFDLINFFSKHPDQVFSRAQLLDSVWGYHHSGYEHTVNSHINRLRNKLEPNIAEPQIIQTVWGVGYKLNSAGVH